MSIAICGPERGTRRKYRCPCCKREWDDPDAIATVMCWGCIYGETGCQRCVELGMVRGTIGREGRRGHIIVTVRKGNMRWLRAACGKTIDWKDMWSANTARPCRRCERVWDEWPRRIG